MIAGAMLETENRSALIEREMDVEDAVYTAVYAGAARLTGDADDESARREACETFFTSLYASFDAVGDPAKRESLSRAVPFLMIGSEDDFYVNRIICDGDDGDGPTLEREWCSFWEYTRDHGEYEGSLTEWLGECLNGAETGTDGSEHGFELNIQLYDGSEILRRMEGETFAAVYVKNGRDDMGERNLTFASADYQSRPRRLFAVTEDSRGRRTYHRTDCDETGEDIVAECYTKKDCALLNAFPCETCFGD